MSHRLLYHQFLSSHRVGGDAKLAFAIHRHVLDERGSVGQLLIPKSESQSIGLRAEGHDRAAIGTAIEDLGFEYSVFDQDQLFEKRRTRSLFANLALYRQMKTYQPGVLHIHSPFLYGALRPFLRLSRFRTILHLHLDYSVEQLKWPLSVPPEKIFLSAKSIRPEVDAALSSTARRNPDVIVLQNSIDTNLFRPSNKSTEKRELGIGETTPLAVIIANLAPHKGHETAIKAIAALARRNIDVTLWIVGEERDGTGKFEKRLKSLVAELNVESQVHFVGFRTDVPDILKAADFLLLPSTSETLSLVVLEALASEAIVLAAPTADLPEVVHDDETGYLIAAEDDLGYANRLAALILDPDRSKELADTGRRYVRENHDLGSYCKTILAQYDDLLGKMDKRENR